MRLARLAHPTFWTWLEQERSAALPPPPFELTALLNSFDVPLAPAREPAIRDFLERHVIDGAPVKVVREAGDADTS